MLRGEVTLLSLCHKEEEEKRERERQRERGGENEEYSRPKTRKTCRHVFACHEHLLRLKSCSNFPLARPTSAVPVFIILQLTRNHLHLNGCISASSFFFLTFV